jgi:Domain of unknown function (DUF1841)
MEDDEYQYDPFVAPVPEEWLALDESERIWLVEDYHRRAGIDLPNAQLHAIIHAVVEAQIATGDELPVQRTLQRLMAEGLDRHDALHAIGAVLAEHIHGIMTEPAETSRADPNQPYFAALARLTAKGWRASG